MSNAIDRLRARSAWRQAEGGGLVTPRQSRALQRTVATPGTVAAGQNIAAARQLVEAGYAAAERASAMADVIWQRLQEPVRRSIQVVQEGQHLAKESRMMSAQAQQALLELQRGLDLLDHPSAPAQTKQSFDKKVAAVRTAVAQCDEVVRRGKKWLSGYVAQPAKRSFWQRLFG